MSIRFSVKRLALATVTISKTHGGDISGYVPRQATIRLFTAFRQTEAYRHNEQSSTNITNDDRYTTTIAGDDDHNDNDRIQEDKVAVELKDVSQPVDTTKYRGVEELRQQTGGEDKSP
ncbi:hypothetical protein HID58_003306 [Brassica napus]|uniref:BnaA01g28750D protein n=3 Tax=Brassica TaxID=3705 RepID=A0A078G578_BRANA|nr:hypothetical protein HID58_003306 [Brassica napus]CAF2154957.1 unnamed protein product [Brassica napus]CAG7890175.1 unnamed protein product [Brassica rapa]CDY20127.1 BnaA01g28750D [Brassica napus]VDC77422.1 unnamed protein product [Brassica rapa]